MLIRKEFFPERVVRQSQHDVPVPVMLRSERWIFVISHSSYLPPLVILQLLINWWLQIDNRNLGSLRYLTCLCVVVGFVSGLLESVFLPGLLSPAHPMTWDESAPTWSLLRLVGTG